MNLYQMMKKDFIKKINSLQKVALSTCVKNMAEFHNTGYRNLYNERQVMIF